MSPLLRLLLLAATTAVAFGHPGGAGRRGRLSGRPSPPREAAGGSPCSADRGLVGGPVAGRWPARRTLLPALDVERPRHRSRPLPPSRRRPRASLPRARTARAGVPRRVASARRSRDRRRDRLREGGGGPVCHLACGGRPRPHVRQDRGWPHPVERPALRDHGALPTARARLDRPA